MKEKEFIRKCKEDPVFYVENTLGIKLYHYKKEMIKRSFK